MLLIEHAVCSLIILKILETKRKNALHDCKNSHIKQWTLDNWYYIYHKGSSTK